MKVRVRVEPPEAAPFERDFDSAEIVVGRSTTAGLVITDTNASRRHARFVHRDDWWWIEDLGATNPTFLNDQPLKGSARLGPGDQVRIGQTRLFLTTDFGRPVDQAARLRLLNDVHRALAAPISLSELLDLILARCFDVLGPEEGVILLGPPGGEMSRAASRRLPGARGELLVSRRIVDEVAGKGRPVLVLDLAEDERFSHSDSMVASGVRSVVAAPLTDAESTIGLIALYSRASVRRFSQQDLDLLESLASAAALRVRNVALAEEAAERRVLERELALAHEMQMAMLPKRLPERPEVAVAAALKPARSVGGDLYDFVLDDDRLWFIVGDVSGKGVPGALYMAVAKTLFRATARGEIAPAGVLARMNTELGRENDGMMFVTAVVGHLTLSTGRLVMADAGHNLVVLAGRDGHSSVPAMPRGTALGVDEDFVYAELEIALDPGATLVLYTDGVTDARNTSGEAFGTDRLNRALAASMNESPDTIVRAVSGEVEAFSAGAAPEDDITLLALRFKGGS